ncbi:unnamed protein product [Rhizophagus irregularis]|nr:unnamed protein product [Rhizophagus irregularis]
MVSDQFYRGLLPENVIEVSRIGSVPLNALLDRLNDLERRKGEMFYGLQRRQGIEKAKKEELAGYTHPCDSTQRFGQFVNHRSIDKQIKPVRPKPPRRVIQDHQDPDYDDGYEEHDVGDDPGAPEWTLEDHQNAIDLIIGYKRGTSRILTNQLQKAKDRRDDQELARAMRNLDLNDDAMDIDNNVASFDDLNIVPNEEGGYRICVVRSAKKKSADFRNLLREILQEEMSSVKKVVEIPGDQEQEEDTREDVREDDPMDIDITRLENTKDLLALGGEVNGISIQCLADTCANVSFIQRETAEELGLVIDKSITHNISGAPGSSRTFGMVKGVSIQLTPECVITEDLAVLDGYKHREIGLSRTCLKRYNYDVHESREHVALTCDGKNVFIPIVPDINRGDKK